MVRAAAVAGCDRSPDTLQPSEARRTPASAALGHKVLVASSMAKDGADYTGSFGVRQSAGELFRISDLRTSKIALEGGAGENDATDRA